MIRREAGDEYWLITQDDHARLSGEMAASFGNDRFAPPSQGESTLLGISLHDCGWPLHDDAPTLNDRGLPLDVFETPWAIAYRVWSEAPRRAAQEDAYAALLVSLHVFWLSLLDKGVQLPARDRFELNKFQHAQIEWWEKLRPQLGLATDRSLQHGLEANTQDPRELALTFDLRLLQAMDRLSLFVCCTSPPFRALEPVIVRPGGDAVRIALTRVSDSRCELDPWPFNADRLDLHVPFRRLKKSNLGGDAMFRMQFRAIAVEHYPVTLCPRLH